MKPNEIILHCAATKEGQEFTIKDIDSWHRKRGFKKVGYHFVIKLDGTIEIGRAENEIGAHCLKHNSKSIGICYIGGLDSEGKPKDTRTKEQKEAMYRLVGGLMLKYDLKPEDIHTHSEFANKACPCFTREEFLNELDNWLKDNILNKTN